MEILNVIAFLGGAICLSWGSWLIGCKYGKDKEQTRIYEAFHNELKLREKGSSFPIEAAQEEMSRVSYLRYLITFIKS